jgi:hypothetical protein
VTWKQMLGIAALLGVVVFLVWLMWLLRLYHPL